MWEFALRVTLNLFALTIALMFIGAAVYSILFKRNRFRLNRKLYILLINRTAVDVFLLLISSLWNFYLEPKLRNNQKRLVIVLV